MNGWQRLWIFVGVIWIVGNAFYAMQNSWIYSPMQERMLFTWRGIETFTAALVIWIGLYPLGKSIAWVVRGFKKK